MILYELLDSKLLYAQRCMSKQWNEATVLTTAPLNDPSTVA